MLFIIKPLITHFIGNLNLINRVLLWRWLEPLEELPGKSSLKKLVSIHCNPEDSFKNYQFFTK